MHCHLHTELSIKDSVTPHRAATHSSWMKILRCSVPVVRLRKPPSCMFLHTGRRVELAFRYFHLFSPHANQMFFALALPTFVSRRRWWYGHSGIMANSYSHLNHFYLPPEKCLNRYSTGSSDRGWTIWGVTSSLGSGQSPSGSDAFANFVLVSAVIRCLSFLFQFNYRYGVSEYPSWKISILPSGNAAGGYPGSWKICSPRLWILRTPAVRIGMRCTLFSRFENPGSGRGQANSA